MNRQVDRLAEVLRVAPIPRNLPAGIWVRVCVGERIPLTAVILLVILVAVFFPPFVGNSEIANGWWVLGPIQREQGVVDSVRSTGIEVNGRPVFGVTFQFAAPSFGSREVDAKPGGSSVTGSPPEELQPPVKASLRTLFPKVWIPRWRPVLSEFPAEHRGSAVFAVSFSESPPQMGASVWVSYCASRPLLARVDGMRTAPLAAAQASIVLVFGGIACGVLAIGVLRGVRLLRLLRLGYVGSGTVRQNGSSWADTPGGRRHHILVQVRLPGGDVATVRAQIVDPAAYSIGVSLPVLYHPSNPRGAMLIEEVSALVEVGANSTIVIRSRALMISGTVSVLALVAAVGVWFLSGL